MRKKITGVEEVRLDQVPQGITPSGTTVVPKALTAEDFVNAYNELCRTTGYRMVVKPSFVSRDDGTFSIVVQYSVERIQG